MQQEIVNVDDNIVKPVDDRFHEPLEAGGGPEEPPPQGSLPIGIALVWAW